MSYARSELLIKFVIASLIISGFVSPAIAYDTSSFQWRDGTSGRLARGEELSYDVYTVKVVAFPAPVKSNSMGSPAEPVDTFVGLNISKNGQFLTTAMLTQGDYYIAPDGEIKIIAKLLPSKEGTVWVYESYAPWADIEISPRGIPGIEVLVETNYNEYLSLANTEITASVTIRNTGSADLLNANAEIKTSLPLKKGVLKYHYERVRRGESMTNSIVFAAPIITELKNYEIIANATGYDTKDLFYAAQSSKTIAIAPEPDQIPTIRKNVNAKIYLEEYAMVSISFKNNGNFELKNVSVTDSIPNGFVLLSNNTMQWKFTVPPMGEWDTRYLIRPTKANKEGAVLPPANAEFMTQKEYYTIQSNQPSIVVHGPKISLTKQVDVSSIDQGDTVTVTVSAENVGSTPTKVSIKDRLPSEGTLVSGVMSHEDFLEAGKAARFSYSIRIDTEPPVKLPSATAEYNLLDARSGTLTATSNEPEIGKKVPVSEATYPENAPPDFEIGEVAPTPVPTPELPFTPIVYDDEVQLIPQETPFSMITPPSVSSQEIGSVLNILLGFNYHNLVALNDATRTIGIGGTEWAGHSTMDDVIQDYGNHNIKTGIFADNFEDNDLNGWTTTGGNHTVSNGIYKQQTDVVEWITARPTTFSYDSPAVILAKVNVADNGTYLDEGLGWGGSTWTSNNDLFAGRRDAWNQWQLNRNNIIDSSNTASRTLNVWSDLQLYKKSDNYTYGSSYNNVLMSSSNSPTYSQYPYILGSSQIIQFWDEIRIVPLDSNNNIITKGNLTTWYDAGIGKETYQIEVNAITPENTNYTVQYRENGTGSFTQLDGVYTNRNTIPLSLRYQNTDVRITLNGNEKVTPELVSITFYR